MMMNLHADLDDAGLSGDGLEPDDGHRTTDLVESRVPGVLLPVLATLALVAIWKVVRQLFW